jgi:hypothetical protein
MACGVFRISAHVAARSSGDDESPGYYALLVATITADMADQWVVNLALMASSASPPVS